MQILKATDITTEKISAVIYAPPGMGKTTLLGMLPGKTLVIDVDCGTVVLKGNPNVDIVKLDESLSGLKETLTYLQKKCEYDNVCIDSLSELERGMLTVYGRGGKNNGAPELAHYNQVQFKIMDYVRLYRALPANVIFTAWESLTELIHQSGEKYTQTHPMLAGKGSDSVCGLCHIVGRIMISPKDGERYVWLEGSPTVVAKDRIFKRKYCKLEDLLTGDESNAAVAV